MDECNATSIKALRPIRYYLCEILNVHIIPLNTIIGSGRWDKSDELALCSSTLILVQYHYATPWGKLVEDIIIDSITFTDA